MADKEVCRLVKELLDGNVIAAAPLFDRLQEIQDVRAGRLSFLLGRLSEVSASISQDFSDKGRRRRQTPEEVAYRRDSSCRENWNNFSQEVKCLFWMEIKDNILVDLNLIQKNMQTVKQASRLASPEIEGEEGYTDEGENYPMKEGPRNTFTTNF